MLYLSYLCLQILFQQVWGLWCKKHLLVWFFLSDVMWLFGPLSKTWNCILQLGAVARNLIGRKLGKVWMATSNRHHKVKNETRSEIYKQSISFCMACSGWCNTYGYSYQEHQLQGQRQTLENLSAWVNGTLLLPQVKQMEGKLLCWILLLFN